ncbi:multiple sugar transport system substrate-binding protein [Paenibacillus sp. UNCCL117]|uniref:extracellular solute-binding protein n=1 Tax=unclassified Paenibacillus TaxID=185978 RepID=UPI00088C7F06|nr:MULTISPECIES: extracellular solute-binding protein [unclassified Paenibacillus]SDC95701.1 multiple sugar transport system substrate-binding protein [Paenibacillus sp. cl123]SFW30125.1 multiple sugar transport system substrate-binding protein [Paenibacillus sp. UNCCL117]
MTRRPSRRTFRPRLDEMVSSIRKNIITGTIEPDQFLPSEKQLAEQYGLSVQSVRKGLELLVADELIIKIPKIGSKVVDPAHKSAVTIRIGYLPTIPDDADIHRLIAMFHQEHPNIHVEAVPLASFSYELMKPYLQSGMLDVTTLNYDHFMQFSNNASLHELEALDRQEGIYPFLSDAFTEDGQLRIQPFVFSPLVVCYNRSHFIQSGLQEPNSSWSWQRLFDTAASLTIPNERVGFHCYFSTHNRASIILLQSGGAFERQENGRLKLSGTRMMEAIRDIRDIYKNSPKLPNSLMDWETQRLDMFRQGKLSIAIMSYFTLNHLRNTELDYDIAPLPHSGIPLTLLLNIGLAINARSKNKEAAKKLVDYVTSPKAQLAIRQNTCSLPALVTAAEWRGQETPGINLPSRHSLFREIIPSYRLPSELNITFGESIELYKELRLYWAGLKGEEDLCEAVEGIGV